MLETAVIEAARSHPPGSVVIDGLAAFARRWGTAKAIAFFSRVCPRLFDLGAVAYWRAPRAELGRSFIEQVTNVTQCVLEIGDGHLRVVKAEGRPASVQGRLLRLELVGRRGPAAGRAGPRPPRPGPRTGPARSATCTRATSPAWPASRRAPSPRPRPAGGACP